jgi:septal ring factor EnvC (AmiA/AmiB activator)
MHISRATCVALLMSSFSLFAFADALKDKKVELQKLKETISSFQKQAAQTKSQYQKELDALKDADRAVGRSKKELRSIENKLQGSEQRLALLAKQKSDKQKLMSENQSLLAEQIRSAHRVGELQSLRVLLNQQNPQAVSRTMKYFEYFNSARSGEISQAETRIAELINIESEIAKAQADLLPLREEQRYAIAGLNEQRQHQARVISQLDRQLKDDKTKLNKLLVDRRQLEQLIEQLAKADIKDDGLLVAEPFRSRRGKLSWPTSGRLTELFGTAKTGSLTWDGVMISTKVGEPIRAIHSGRVVYADWLRGLGLLVILDHGDNYLSLYGHNETINKSIGDWVDSKEVIGAASKSRSGSQAEVYFGIRYKGRPSNPKKWCQRDRKGRVG